MKSRKINFIAALLMLTLPASTTAQSGGDFVITQTVIAGGGGASAGGGFAIESTGGQPVAGVSTAPPFGMSIGFWNFSLAPPTSAQVTISGRVLTSGGEGIRRALVTLTGANGIPRSVRTGTFGFYSFENVTVGETYILSVSAGKYTFVEPTRVITVVDEIGNINFTADL